MRKCPYCAEEIQDDAIKCKHCKEWLKKQYENAEVDPVHKPEEEKNDIVSTTEEQSVDVQSTSMDTVTDEDEDVSKGDKGDKRFTHLKGTCQAKKAIPKARKRIFLANIFELPPSLPLPQFRYV